MKMVFVTASPVLTNEVKQYYANLKQQLAAHLVVVESTKQQESEDQKAQEEGKSQPNPDEEVKIEKANDGEREKLLKFLEIKEQEILQAE